MTGAIKGEPDAGPLVEGKAPPYLLQPQPGPQPPNENGTPAVHCEGYGCHAGLVLRQLLPFLK